MSKRDVNSGFAVLTTTLPDAEGAASLARALVEAKLAACVQIVAIRSVYRWKGAIADEVEHRLDVKIAAADFVAASRFIRGRHPYEVPELVMTPLADIDPAYRDWLAAAIAR